MAPSDEATLGADAAACAPHVCRTVEHDVERVQVPPLPLDAARLSATLDAALRAVGHDGMRAEPRALRSLALSQPLGGWPYGANAPVASTAPAAASTASTERVALSRVPALWPLASFSALAALRLDGAGLSEVPECVYALAPTLKLLSMISNRLSALPARLGTLTRLIELDVSSNGIVKLDAAPLAPLQALRYLYVRDNELSSVALPLLARLHTLALSGNEGVGAAPAGVVVVEALPSLAVLSLAGCRLAGSHEATPTPPSMESNCAALAALLAQFRSAPLRHLSLAGNGLDDVRAAALAVAAARLWGATLQELDMSHNGAVRLGSRAAHAFALPALRAALPSLAMLRLANACLGAGALRRLTPIAPLGGELVIDACGALSEVPEDAVRTWIDSASKDALRVLRTIVSSDGVSDAADAVHGDWLLVGSQRSALARAALLARTPAVSTIVSVLDGAETPYTRDFYYHVYALEDDAVANLRAVLDRATACIARAREERGGAVLVHCHAGRSRSVSVALAYVMRYARTPRTRERMTRAQAEEALAEALAAMRVRRREVNPSAHFQRVLVDWAVDTLLY